MVKAQTMLQKQKQKINKFSIIMYTLETRDEAGSKYYERIPE